jgi:NAD(P)-dependent dehydrogenase (short-subunit alcohol dehydrogenase family)
MVANRSGVIMTLTATPSRTGVPFVGGGGPAMAAVEALTRGLSAELAPQGIRVVGLRPQGMPEPGRINEVSRLSGKALGITVERFTSCSQAGPPRATAYDACGDDSGGGLPGFR